MKGIVALLLIAVIGFCAYKYHADHVQIEKEEAARVAREKALADANRAAQAKAKADAERAAKEKALAEANKPKPELPPPVAISRQLEPLYVQLLTDLSAENPVNYVPRLEMTKERISDKRGKVEPGKQAVYDHAGRLVAGMITFGEERTKALDSLLKSQFAKPSALNAADKGNAVNSFFAQGVAKRWNDERARRKPVIDALFASLRQAEREWNQRASPAALPDSFDAPDITDPRLSVDAPPSNDNPPNRPRPNR